MNENVTRLLAGLDRPAEPSPAFAAALYDQLLPRLAPPAARPRPRVRRPFLRVRDPRLRLLLIVLSALLMLAALAAAASYVLRWTSDAPRAPQVRSDYTLARVQQDPSGRFWSAYALDPAGEQLLAVRQPWPSRRAELVRVGPRPEPLLDLAGLAEPRLWPGIDPRGLRAGLHTQTLASPAPGHAFLVAGLYPQRGIREMTVAPRAVSVVAVRPGAPAARVVSPQELGLTVPDPFLLDLQVASADPARVFVLAWAPKDDRRDGPVGPFSLFTVDDPNADGVWTDRRVRRLAIGPEIALGDRVPQGYQRARVGQIVAERDGTLLVSTLSREGDVVLYRMDPDDPAKPRRLFQRRLDGSGDFPRVRIAPHPDGVAATGLSNSTRVSIIGRDGVVRDIGRGFEGFGIDQIVADPDGRIYVAVQEHDGEGAPHATTYRFDPAVRERRETGFAPTPEETETKSVLAFSIMSLKSMKGEIVTVPPTGERNARSIVPGDYNHQFCLSSDRRRMLYGTEAKVPNEPHLYLADRDGSGAKLVTERSVGWMCRFDDRYLVLMYPRGGAHRLMRHDLRTGREVQVAAESDMQALSPSGETVLYTGGLKFDGGVVARGRPTLELVHLPTMRRRRLAGPLPRGYRIDPLVVHPEGGWIAYVSGPSDRNRPPRVRRREVVVQTTSGFKPRVVARFRGGPPVLRWRNDGEALLICAPLRATTCNGSHARLLLVPRAGGRPRLVVKGRVLFADFVPNRQEIVYATARGIFLKGAGRAVKVAGPPSGGWPAGEFIGISPNGRYLGLGNFSARVVVTDLTTGEHRLVYRDRPDTVSLNHQWWPAP